MESGERRVESGERRVENGERRVENGDTRQQDLSSLTPQASPLATDALPLVTPIAAEQASNAIASTESPASTSETGEEAPPADTHQAKGPGEPPLHVDNIVWAPNIIIPSSDEEGVRTFGLRFSSEVSDFRIRIYNRQIACLVQQGNQIRITRHIIGNRSAGCIQGAIRKPPHVKSILCKLFN